MKPDKPCYLDWLFLALLGLVPLLWFRSEGLLISGDMLPPMSWEAFMNRFFTWDERLGGGHESLLHFSVMFFHFVEAVLTTICPTLLMAQKVEFMLWFFLSGVGIYYLLGVMLEGEGKRIGRWVGVIFYLFNLYLEPIWQGMNMANLSCFIYIPIMLGLTMECFQRKRPYWFCVVAVGLLTFFCAPIGTNPPMLLVTVFPFVIYGLFYLFKNRVWFNLKELCRFFGFFILVGIMGVLLNLFWIYPFILQVFVNTAQTSLEFTPGSNLDWLKSLSTNTSLFNVAKMQGAWVWYSGFGEPYIPYSALYQTNPFFLILGFMLPVIAGIGFVISRHKLAGLLFGSFALIGVIFGTGVHPPFGKLYAWLVENIPFFYIIRSPWYKFTFLVCVGYAGLFALLGQRLATVKVGKKKVLASITIFLLCAYNVVYAFPISTGRHFLVPEDREFMTHNYMDIPEYVNEAVDFIKKDNNQFRVFEATAKKHQEYTWGNYAFNHILTSYSLTPVFYSSMVNSPSLYPGDEMVKMLHRAIKLNNRSQFVGLLKNFKIKRVLFPYDLHWYEMADIQGSSKIWEFLEGCDDLVLEERFGPWRIYSLEGLYPSSLYVTTEPYFVMGSWTLLPSLLNTPQLEDANFVFVDSLRDVLKHKEIDPLKLILVNMNVEQLAAAELGQEFGLGQMARSKQQLSFEQKKTESIQIWVQAKGDDLLKLSNMLLDKERLKVSSQQIYPGQASQWLRIYSGTLKEGTHTLYLRNPTRNGGIEQVAVIPESKIKSIQSEFQSLFENKKIEASWLKTVQKGGFEFNAAFSFPLKSSQETKFNIKSHLFGDDQDTLLWTGDVLQQNIADIDIKPQHKGVEYFRAAEGWTFKFLDKVVEGAPSVVILFHHFEPVLLKDFPDVYLDFKLYDVLSCDGQIKFYLQDEKGEDFETVLPLARVVPLYDEISRYHPEKQGVVCTGIDLEINHSFKHRKGFRRYPNKDLLLREVKMGQINFKETSESDQVTGDRNNRAQVNWSLSDQVRESNLWVPYQQTASFEKESVESVKVDPTHYTLDFEKPTKGSLVLNQGYHPLWQAKTAQGKELLHFKFNGWENGYILTGEQGDVELRFEPQQKVLLGCYLSGGTGLVLLLVFSLLYWRRKQ